MRLVVISGRSGSGKSTALHVLEDENFYCIDNLPAGMLAPLIHHLKKDDYPHFQGVAISIDARNTGRDLELFPSMFAQARTELDCEVIYLDASRDTLVKRFSETRRKHPLSTNSLDLVDAIDYEKELLSPMADLASLTIDTSQMNLYQLRQLILDRVVQRNAQSLALQFLSFGFKHGIPVDADLVFDARHLPNPYWNEALRSFTGRDREVQEFLNSHETVAKFLHDIEHFLQQWLPHYQQNRRYLTVAIGCTGGQHRSVFMCEQLQNSFIDSYPNTQVKHRELGA